MGQFSVEITRLPGSVPDGNQQLAQLGAVDEAVNATQEVIAGDMILKPELVEQALLHHETLAHHGPILR
jgi:hypothetical protein